MTQQIVAEKEIVYDRITKDFAAYLNGDLIGFYATYKAAEEALDRVVYKALKGAV
jgi:hypothetical protein